MQVHDDEWQMKNKTKSFSFHPVTLIAIFNARIHRSSLTAYYLTLKNYCSIPLYDDRALAKSKSDCVRHVLIHRAFSVATKARDISTPIIIICSQTTNIFYIGLRHRERKSAGARCTVRFYGVFYEKYCTAREYIVNDLLGSSFEPYYT